MNCSRRQLLTAASAATLPGALIPKVLAAKPLTDSDWDRADGVTLAQWVARGQASPGELLQASVRRLREVNPAVNLLAQDHIALAEQQLRSGLPSGAFSGVPFLLKDLGSQLAGTVTSGGSALNRSAIADTDSTLVTRYRQAGLNIFGKTNTPEFGLALTTEGSHLGDCRNPWNLGHSTGGSSGGSAAAVATGVVPMAHATDGGGSIRVPANHCGVFGLKPTRGLTPGATGPGMTAAHIVSRSVRDSALMLELTAGYQAGAPWGRGLPAGNFFEATLRPPKPLRIALNLVEPAVELDPEVVDAVTHVAVLLESLGHQVEEAAPGVDYALLNATQNALIASDVAAWLDHVEILRGGPIGQDELEPMTWMIRKAGSAYRGTEVAGALQAMHQLGLQMGRFHEKYDMILQPVTATPAPKLGAITYRPGDTLESYTGRFKAVSAFTHLYNMTGQPSMSVPLAMSASGLPIGIMLSAAVGNDASLLGLAAQLERAAPWFDRRPPIPVI